jgi:hypothetical protein
VQDDRIKITASRQAASRKTLFRIKPAFLANLQPAFHLPVNGTGIPVNPFTFSHQFC